MARGKKDDSEGKSNRTGGRIEAKRGKPDITGHERQGVDANED
jgi:hypothetical protein